MSYYAMGDYYRGDPFLGGLIGIGAKLIGKAAPVIGRAVGIGRKVVRSVPGQVAIGAAGTAAVLKVAGVNGGGGGGFRRRMNVLNMRALDRSIRRLKGFEKRVRKVVRYTRPGAQATVKVRRKRKCS